MHDVFEGVLSYDIPLICASLVKRGHLSLAILNHRLQNFHYGYHDVTNRPPVLSSLDMEMLPFDAGQSWCITRVLALAGGDLVPEDDDVWLFYLLLRDVVDIIVAPSVSVEHLNQMRTLVGEYLELRKLLFPDHVLKNKHHHLTHYASLTEKVGPLQRFSCMRFESKHQRSKKLLHISGNFKNVAKTCAFRHQHDMCFRLLRSKESSSDVVVGTGSVITLSELDDGFEINNCLGGIGTKIELFDANWVEIRGIRYKPGCVVIAGMESDNNCPVFVDVEHILVRNHGEFLWIVGGKLPAQYFSSHYHAWSVQKCLPKILMSVSHTSLTYFTPLTLNSKVCSGETMLWISLRHHF